MAARLIALGFAASLSGCAWTAKPEINPARFAPVSDRSNWTPPPRTANEWKISAAAKLGTYSQQTPRIYTGQSYDLTGLIDLALSNNPDTRGAWESARAAAAAYGGSRAAYYPRVSIGNQSGYNRLLFQLPHDAAVIKQWESAPVAEMTYTLLDFGRRSSEAEIARQHLVAANFAFDRKIQDIVFNTERTFYALDAARAAVLSAKRNLELARTDYGAVKESLDNGLATQPELLLAKERVAQSRYDLANARLIVRESQANLSVALGLPANTPIKVQTLESQSVPSSLSAGVDELIEETMLQRPDLAASVAGLRARQAEIKRAAAQWYPVVTLGADYGQQIWSYTLNGTAANGTNEPFYSALINLRWDVFTGFKRRNDDIRADAQLHAAAAGVKSLELTAIAQIWQAYFQFESAREKYRYGQALLASAKEAYDANSQTYRNGLSTIVELLTAQSDLANARYTFIQSKADLLTSYAAVAYAAGAIQATP